MFAAGATAGPRAGGSVLLLFRAPVIELELKVDHNHVQLGMCQGNMDRDTVTMITPTVTLRSRQVDGHGLRRGLPASG